MGAFTDQLQAFANNVVIRSDNTVAEIIRGVALSLVERSPVGDPALWASKPPKGYEGGRFKANWQGQIGSIDYTTTEDIDPTGEISISSIYGRIPSDIAGSVFYISNSLPYAQVLEDGSQSKQVPPGGMVGITVLEFNAIVQNAVLKVAT